MRCVLDIFTIFCSANPYEIVLLKKMGEGIKMQSTGKRQFRWRNEMMEDLISSLENFTALMKFKGNY